LLSDWNLSLGDLSGLALLLDVNDLLSGIDLDVCLAREVRADTTVGSVGTTASLGSSIDCDVINGEVLKVFGVGIGFEVVDQSKDGLHGLLGPSTEGLAELSSLSGSTDTSEVGGVGDAASVSEDILEVLLGLGDGQTLDCLGGLVGILVMNSEISSGAFGD
jgi:hypothetical protein